MRRRYIWMLCQNFKGNRDNKRIWRKKKEKILCIFFYRRFICAPPKRDPYTRSSKYSKQAGSFRQEMRKFTKRPQCVVLAILMLTSVDGSWRRASGRGVRPEQQKGNPPVCWAAPLAKTSGTSDGSPFIGIFRWSGRPRQSGSDQAAVAERWISFKQVAHTTQTICLTFRACSCIFRIIHGGSIIKLGVFLVADASHLFLFVGSHGRHFTLETFKRRL